MANTSIKSAFERMWQHTITAINKKQDAGDYALNSSLEGLATETYVDNKVADLVNSAPDKLNTLDELAAALGDDENFANTVTEQISGKADKATTLVGYGITDAYTSAQTDSAIDEAVAKFVEVSEEEINALFA